MDVNGNDYPLAKEVEKLGGYTYHVKNYADTYQILREISDLVK